MECLSLVGRIESGHLSLHKSRGLIQSLSHAFFDSRCRIVRTVPQLVLFRLVANAQDRTLKDVLRVAGCNVTGRMDAPEGGEDIPDGGRRVQHVGLGLRQCTGVCNALCQSQRDILADLRHDLGRRMGVEGSFAGINYGVCNLFGSVRRVFLAFELAFCHAFACIFANACEQLVKSGRHGIAILQFIQNICERQYKSLGRNTFVLSAPVFWIKRIVVSSPCCKLCP